MKRKLNASVLNLLINHKIKKARIEKYGRNYYIVNESEYSVALSKYNVDFLEDVYPFQTKELCLWVMKQLNITNVNP
jgi:hypothetical protein